MQFSYFPLVAAFVPADGEPAVDGAVAAVALAVAPFVFVAFGFLSRHPRAPRAVLQAMAAHLLVGLSFGLVTPAFGAAAGFGVGAALTLNLPPVEGVMRRRFLGLGMVLAYVLALLFFVTPAGVFSGAVLPALAVGFADEVSLWRGERGSVG